MTSSKLELSYIDKVLHELITPIHAILNLSDIVHTEWNNIDNKTKLESIADIHQSANTNHLVDSLRQMASINNSDIKFSFDKVNLFPVVTEALALVQHKLVGKNLKTELNTKIEDCIVNIDRFWFRQLLINLLNNSIHYSKKGIISVNIDIVTNSNGKNLLIAVQDQGTGIKDDELEMIFQPFKQGSKGKVKVTGSGIGLAVCKEIVEAHKGKITAKNNSESTGATVEFTIPLT